MSVFHLNIIKDHLEQVFEPHIDASDLATKSATEREIAIHSRALAAFAISTHVNSTPEVMANSVTDEYGDNGIDALFFDNETKTLYLAQSKWSVSGNGSISSGDVHKFLSGVDDLIQPRFDKFGRKLLNRRHIVETALRDPLTRCVLLIAYSGQGSLGQDIRRNIEEFLEKLNDAAEFAGYRSLRQADLYNIIYSGAKGDPIDIDVVLNDWGRIESPFRAFYGHVSAADIAQWHKDHYPAIVAPNIRNFLGNTEVNESISRTLQADPEKFWYFNNGITVLCSSINKKPMGGPDRASGVFKCEGVMIVNGAQTIGAVAHANEITPDQVANARVFVRFISLEDSPQSFQKDVTRNTNTQNRIEKRDFVSLDPQQERLRGELLLREIEYLIKSGETASRAQDSFDVIDATVARACLQHDVTHAVQAKREIGRLWDDIDTPPYTLLFNASVNSLHLWRSVQMLRVMESAFRNLQHTWQDRNQLYAYHANRFVEHLVFRKHADVCDEETPNLSDAERKQIETDTLTLLTVTMEVTERQFEGSYLASLFKNISKCKQIAKQVYTAM